jgi:hypothetical protein
MNIKIALALGAMLLSGCVSDDSGEAFLTRPATVEGKTITDAVIETCWKQAGIKGDLYKFMTPEEAAGIQPGGVFSKSQHAAFTACLRA